MNSNDPMSDAYDMLDLFLRNNLGDDDYAEYSVALDQLAAAPAAPAPQRADEPAAWGLLDPATGKLHFELIGEYKDCEYWANEGTECRGWTITPIYTAAPAAPAYVPPNDELIYAQWQVLCDSRNYPMTRDLLLAFARAIESLVVARMRGEGK